MSAPTDCQHDENQRLRDAGNRLHDAALGTWPGLNTVRLPLNAVFEVVEAMNEWREVVAPGEQQ